MPGCAGLPEGGDPGGSSGLDLRKPGLGRERSGFVGWGQGPKGDWHEGKMKKLDLGIVVKYHLCRFFFPVGDIIWE